jgi:hypothetical protein
VCVRWYVEGDTELGALDFAIREFKLTHIDLVNLRGQVAQKRVVAFRENLLSDLNSGTFSLILIDGDRSDFLRAVRKAAEADEICGEFYVSKPDFEFQNFSIAECEEVPWREALKHGVRPEERESLHRSIEITYNGTDLLQLAGIGMPELAHLSKGRYWGECLMRYALEFPDLDSRPRKVIHALRTGWRAHSVSYNIHRREYRINPITGSLEKRLSDPKK